MKQKVQILVFCMLAFSSCISLDVVDNSNKSNFEALWTILDEKYCLFDDKQINWDDIHEEYTQKISGIEERNKVELFDTLASMIDKLEDGHVNLYSDFDVSSSSKWYDNYPANFNSSVLFGKYITSYRTAGGMQYTTLNGNIGYIRYSSFSSGFNESNLRSIFVSFPADCKAVIIDVRHNGGGDITNALKLASIFFEENTIIGYQQHKIGKAHDEFSDFEEILVETALTGVKWLKPVVVLSNRRSYSATNLFITGMKICKTCTIIGGKSGGGGGMPMSYELPNSWLIRFSSVKMTDTDYKSIEDGIEPDIEINNTTEGTDSILEYAINYINKL